MSDLLERVRAAVGSGYRVDRELGGGGMSRVYVAEETRLGRKVVIKVLPPEMAAGVNVERFEREIQLAASLQHPHIVPLLTAGASGDLLYYVMPFIEGESLRARLAREGELPVGTVLRIIKEVVDALAYAHGRGIVHRDIKPDNVLLSGSHALVTDFGVAKAVTASSGGGSLTSLGVALGTPAYMAPEQAAGDPNVDHRADIYAVGVLAYEMLAGRPPFQEPTPQATLAAQVTKEPPALQTLRPSVPPAFAEFVGRCLVKLPADRWQKADEMHALLDTMATPSGGITPTGSAPYAPTAAQLAAATRHGHPLRVAGWFALAAIATLAVVDLAVIKLGLPDWVLWGAIGLLALGLPIMLFTGRVEQRRAIARTTGAMRAAPTEGLSGWMSWKKSLWGGGIAFGALALIAGGYSAMRVLGIGPAGTLVASGRLAERDKLVIADFENRTKDSTLASSVTEAFRIDLSQTPVVKVLDGTAVAQALQRMKRPAGTRLDGALARELAQREGAKAVVAGEIAPLGRGYVLAAHVLSASDGQELVALRETAADDGQIIAAVDKLSKEVRERIGESLRTIRASAPLEQVTTSSLEALRLYSEGAAAADLNDVARSAGLLRQAIAKDSTFGMAWRKLAVILNNEGAAYSDVVAAATKAYQLRDRLPPLEGYLATAYYFSFVEDDPARSDDAYRAALAVDSTNLAALNNLALSYMTERRYADAEPLIRDAASRSTGATFLDNLVRALVAQGKLAAADSAIASATRRLPATSPQPQIERFFMAGARRDYRLAQALADTLEHRVADNPFLLSNVAQSRLALARVQGRLREAERYRQQGVTIDSARGVQAVALRAAIDRASDDVLILGRPADAVKRLNDALARWPLTGTAAVNRPYEDLAMTYAMAGQPAKARQLLAEFEAQVPAVLRQQDTYRTGIEGFIAVAENRKADAAPRIAAFLAGQRCEMCREFPAAYAYDQLGMPDSALAGYERFINTPDQGRLFEEASVLGVTYARLGALYEARGDRARARDYYTRLVDLWAQADAELQPRVQDARARIARLSAEH